MIWSTGGSVTDSMVLPVTSGHVSNTSCESCVFLCFLFVLVRVVACTVNSACLIINQCEISRFEPMNPAKRPMALPSHTGSLVEVQVVENV